MKSLRNLSAFAVGLVVALSAGIASAAGTYDAITTAVDWSQVTTGIVAIAALVAAVLVVSRGSKMLLRMIGR